MIQMNVVMGGQLTLHFMVGVFEFHSSDPVTFGNVLSP